MTDADTTLTVTGAGGFPPFGDFSIKIENEVLYVYSRAGTTFYVQRAQCGTIAASHNMGTTVTRIIADTKDVFNDDDVLVLVPTQQVNTHLTLYLPNDPVVGQVHTFVYYLEVSSLHSVSLVTNKHRFANSQSMPTQPWNMVGNTSPTGGGSSIIYAEVPTKLNKIPGSVILNGSLLGLCGTCTITTTGNISTLTNTHYDMLNQLDHFNIQPGDSIALYTSFGPPVECKKRKVLSVGSNTITTESFEANYSGVNYWQAFSNEGLWFPINL